ARRGAWARRILQRTGPTGSAAGFVSESEQDPDADEPPPGPLPDSSRIASKIRMALRARGSTARLVSPPRGGSTAPRARLRREAGGYHEGGRDDVATFTRTALSGGLGVTRGLRPMNAARMHARARRATLPVLLVLALAAACGGPADYRPVATGDRAPDYAAATLAGDTISLEGLRGQAVLVNSGATWCPPCREEMPELQALEDEYGPRGLRVVGVSIDGRGAEDAVRSFLEDYGIAFTILHDPDERVTRRF